MTDQSNAQCEALVDTEWGPQCSRKGKVEVNGRWLCGVHAKSHAHRSDRDFVPASGAASDEEGPDGR